MKHDDSQEWTFPCDWRQADEPLEKVAKQALMRVANARIRRVRTLPRAGEHIEGIQEEFLNLYCYLELEMFPNERPTALLISHSGCIASLAQAQELLISPADRQSLANAVAVWSGAENQISQESREHL